jgi:RNA polymerase sigma factor (sigma-70 family)
MSATQANTLEPLVTAAAGGDRAAFATLVTETSGVVSSIALAIVRDLDVSRDVAQDVFLAAWRDLRKLRNPASFLPWLRQLTRNRAHHVLRTHVRAKRHLAAGDADAMLDTLADPRPGAAETMIAAEDRTVLAEALAELPDETREVLTLFYREGQSTAHVALLLDLDEAAVRKRLSRARATLKASLLERAGRTMETTKLGGSFTAGVMGALPVAAATAGPATAIAATKTAIKIGLLAKLVLASTGALAGAAFGILGVLFGSRKLLREHSASRAGNPRGSRACGEAASRGTPRGHHRMDAGADIRNRRSRARALSELEPLERFPVVRSAKALAERQRSA